MDDRKVAEYLKNYKVVICDEDASFAIALMNYINRNRRLPILAMVFTDSRRLQEYLISHSVDLLVMDEAIGWQESDVVSETDAGQESDAVSKADVGQEPYILSAAEKRKRQNVKWQTATQIPILWLLRSEAVLQEKDEERVVISKYSKASVLVKRMLELLGTEKMVMGNVQDGISVAVYSPIGRCGKTRLAESLCRYWNIQDAEGNGKYGRSIYLGLEEYGRGGGEAVMETLLYYLKQRSEKLEAQLKTWIQVQSGFDSIPSADCYQELRELDAADIKWLTETLRRAGGYRYLVADIGGGSLADLNILQVFDVIYLPYLQEETVQKKLEVFCNCRRLINNWNEFAKKCYPIAVEDILKKAEGISEMEKGRMNGSLQNLQAWMEERRKGGEEEEWQR